MLKLASKKEFAGKTAIVELTVIALLVVAYVVNMPLLILAIFGAACLLVVLSDREKSICYLAFFTSFARIFSYGGKQLFFIMVALFIIKYVFAQKMDKKTVFFYLIIVAYSLVFCDFAGEFSFAKLIGIILLLAIPLLAQHSDRMDCAELMRHYIFGFTIQTIIGYFVIEIPEMVKLFEYDKLLVAEKQQATRFFGLAFDSNFYALSNYLIVAYLLFGNKKLTWFRGILSIFLLITGLQTLSKSYLLVVAVLLVVFLIKNITSPKRFAVVAVLGVVTVGILIYVNNALGYNVLQIVTDRFDADASFADNTTGRVEIWKKYLDVFNEASVKQLLFGFGFNASVEVAAHNTFIELLYHYGIVGLGIWIAFFVHCGHLFYCKTKAFANKSPIVLCTFLVGIFFLSAYTYEAFWIGLAISLMTLGRASKDGSKIENV